MKQHITKEQWDELSGKQKDKFLGLDKDTMLFAPDNYINIGLMIEFLGDGYLLIGNNSNNDNNLWEVTTKYIDRPFIRNELADALWEAVKEKLNK